MRTFQSEARRLEQACRRGDAIPDLLSDALMWYLYTHGKRKKRTRHKPSPQAVRYDAEGR